MRESPEGTHVKHTRACTHTHTRTYLYVGQSSSSYSRIQESGVHPVFRKLRPLSPFPGISRPRTVFSFWLQCSAISQLFFCFGTQACLECETFSIPSKWVFTQLGVLCLCWQKVFFPTTSTRPLSLRVCSQADICLHKEVTVFCQATWNTRSGTWRPLPLWTIKHTFKHLEKTYWFVTPK